LAIEGDGDIHVELVDVDERSGAKAGVENPYWSALVLVETGCLWLDPNEVSYH